MLCQTLIYKNIHEEAIHIMRSGSNEDMDFSLIPIILSDVNVKPVMKGLIYSPCFTSIAYRLNRLKQKGMNPMELSSVQRASLNNLNSISPASDCPTWFTL